MLTEQTAVRLFGESDVLGRTVTLDGKQEYKVSAVLKDIPSNSHLRFDIIAPLVSRWPLETLESYQGAPDHYTYLLLAPGTDYHELERKADGLLKQVALPGITFSNGAWIWLQPLSRVHLYSSHLEYDNLHWRKANIVYILIFSAVALLLLVVSCINFINLATARSTHRAREVGVRKVVGAGRSQLIRQFLCESVLISLLAVIAAQALIEISRPLLEKYLLNYREIGFANGWRFFLIMTVVTMTVGILSGWYPALFLSLPRPQDVLKGMARGGSVKGLTLRRALVVIQFSASVFLIVCSLFIAKQLHWISRQDLGFNRERVVTVRMSPSIQARYQSVRNELLANSIDHRCMRLRDFGARQRHRRFDHAF